jgi:Annexin
LETLIKWCLEEAEEEFNPNVHTDAKMEEEAEHLHAMGEGRLGTNERGLFKVICTASPKYLQGLNSKYEAKYGHDLAKAVQREMGGVVEKATLYLLGMKLNTYEQVAKLIHDATKGIGTNELLLTTYLIRYQKIMDQVDEAHNRLYRKSVKNLIKFETSGQFERLLVEIAHAD